MVSINNRAVKKIVHWTLGTRLLVTHVFSVCLMGCLLGAGKYFPTVLV